MVEPACARLRRLRTRRIRRRRFIQQLPEGTTTGLHSEPGSASETRRRLTATRRLPAAALRAAGQGALARVPCGHGVLRSCWVRSLVLRPALAVRCSLRVVTCALLLDSAPYYTSIVHFVTTTGSHVCSPKASTNYCLRDIARPRTEHHALTAIPIQYVAMSRTWRMRCAPVVGRLSPPQLPVTCAPYTPMLARLAGP